MLRKYKVSNFKAFGKPDAMPVRPITLIYGPNSSGKSTIVQSLLLLKQTLEEAINVDTVLLPIGNLVNLGEYSDFIHKHDGHQELSYEIFFDLNITSEPDEETEKNNNLFLKVLENFDCMQVNFSLYFNDVINQVSISSIEIYLKDEDDDMRMILSFRLKTKNSSKSLELDKSSLDSEHYFWKLCWKEYENIHRIVGKKIAEDQRERNKDYAQSAKNTTKVEAKTKAIDTLMDLEQYLSGYSYESFINDLLKVSKYLNFYFDKLLNLRIDAEVPKTSEIRNLLDFYETEESLPNPVVNVLSITLSSLRDLLYDVVYIGPIRQTPQREYLLGKDLVDHVGPTGDRIFELFCQKPYLITLVNEWLEKFNLEYQISFTIWLDGDLYTPTDEDDFADKLKNSVDPGNPDDIQIDIRLVDQIHKSEVSLVDVGFGVSQILPIIVQSLASENKLLLIEQPEVHIHPRLQAEVGSLLAECIKSPFNNQFIIETHSEALILRLKSLIKKGYIKSSQLAVIYISRSPKGSRCQHLRLNHSGKFLDDWPDGFFEESFNEILGSNF